LAEATHFAQSADVHHCDFRGCRHLSSTTSGRSRRHGTAGQGLTGGRHKPTRVDCRERSDISQSASNGYVVRSVVRALDVLAELGKAREPMALAAVARQVGMHPTTTLRMLESLRLRGMVRLVDDGRYEVGSATLELGKSFVSRISISRFAYPAVEALAARVDETASIGVLDEGQVLYIAIAHGQHEFGIQSLPYARHPSHCTALGKALLADVASQGLDELLGRSPLEALTPKTITDPDRLRAELRSVAVRGYAVDDEERMPGVLCIAAPVRDHSGKVAAAISVSGPAFRMRRAGLGWLTQAVMEAAAATGEKLGAPADPSVPIRARGR
jgi:DNA-binding IclR family transcriptional regulator